MHDKAIALKHLKSHHGRVFVQRRRIRWVLVVIPVVMDACLLHDEQGGRLCEVAVEQLVQFMPGAVPGEQGSAQPDGSHHAQQQNHQAHPQR